MNYDQTDYNQDKAQKKNIPWAGIVLIFFGVSLILQEFRYFRYIDFWDLWPALLIAWGAVRIREVDRNKFLPSIAIIFGLMILLDNFNILPYYFFDFGNMMAMFFIILGIYIIVQQKGIVSDSNGNETDFIDVTSVFGGTKSVVETKNFKGGQIVSAFGGPEIDLRRAEIGETDAVINVTVIFGGIDLHVPSEWNVINKVVPIFGGCDDTRIQRLEASEVPPKTLIVKGLILFGGVDIK